MLVQISNKMAKLEGGKGKGQVDWPKTSIEKVWNTPKHAYK